MAIACSPFRLFRPRLPLGALSLGSLIFVISSLMQSDRSVGNITGTVAVVPSAKWGAEPTPTG
jgi:hypothetical protein